MPVVARPADDRGSPVPVAVDAVVGAALGAVILAAAVTGVGPVSAADSRAPDAGAVALVAVAAAAIAGRRRHPVAVLAVLNVVTLAWFLAGYPGRLITLVALIGCYALAEARGWRWGGAGAAATALIQILAVRVVLADTTTVGVVPDVVLSVATATSAGAAVGYYRAVLAATRLRLVREAETREERARRATAEERLHVAHELHDVIGHAMATIGVQAGVGLHVVDRRPEQAREALAAIKKICDEGLTDVRTVLDVLRADREVGSASAPRGGFDRLTALLDRTRAAGLRLDMEVHGDPRPLPVDVELATYRIVQEALTNVQRHAGATTVRVTLTHEPSRLTIRVRDDGRGRGPRLGGTSSGRTTGHGIDGMRDRALALSGRATAGPHPEGGFEVSAELPVPDRP
jgi:signal transduction histidine kinase